MEELKIFTNIMFGEVRVLNKNGEPWFVAKDVCKILDLSDVSMSISRLDEDEKLIQTLFVSGQNRDFWTINESGLYSLVFTSRKPEAKDFKKWVTAEVLPSIRKHGAYATEDLLNDPDLFIKVLTDLKEEKKRNTQLENTFAKIEDNLPHDGEYTAQILAQRFGIFSESGLPHAAVINYILRDLDHNYDYQRSKKIFALYRGLFFREVYTCAPTGTRYKELMYNQKAYDYLKSNYDILLKQSARRTKSGLRILGQKRKLYYTLFDDNF